MDAPALSQAEAERLVRELHSLDVTDSFAVREAYRHIIPKDLRSSVRVTAGHQTPCSHDDTYCLEDER